jgi:hypothetical protein
MRRPRHFDSQSIEKVIVTCNSCHAALGKWGDIKAAALKELIRASRKFSRTLT